MNRRTSMAVALGFAVAFDALVSTSAAQLPLASATDSPTPPSFTEQAVEALKYERQAAQLEGKSDRLAKLAADYRARVHPGDKRALEYFTQANYCDQHAERYRKAALEVRRRAEAERALNHTD